MHSVAGWRNVVETRTRSFGQRVYNVFRNPLEQDTRLFDPAEGTCILAGNAGGAGNWEGAPDVLYDSRRDELYLYTRSRHRFKRGHLATIWRHIGGTDFEPVWQVDREDLGAVSLEGAALQQDAAGYRLYLSYQDAASGDWRVRIIPADDPTAFRPGAGSDLVVSTRYRHMKDPVIHKDTLYLHTAPWHFLSTGAVAVDISGTPSVQGKLSFGRDEGLAPRLTSTLSVGDRTVGFYDWRPSYFHTTEERTRYGLLTGDTVRPATDQKATVRATSGTGSLRYVTATVRGDEAWLFYEKSVENGSHGLFLNKVSETELVDVIQGFPEQ